jgi:hypothetical protein
MSENLTHLQQPTPDPDVQKPSVDTGEAGVLWREKYSVLDGLYYPAHTVVPTEALYGDHVTLWAVNPGTKQPMHNIIVPKDGYFVLHPGMMYQIDEMSMESSSKETSGMNTPDGTLKRISRALRNPSSGRPMSATLMNSGSSTPDSVDSFRRKVRINNFNVLPELI